MEGRLDDRHGWFPTSTAKWGNLWNFDETWNIWNILEIIWLHLSKRFSQATCHPLVPLGRGNTRTGVLQLHGLKNFLGPKIWMSTNHLPCILALSSKSILAASSLETWPLHTNPPGKPWWFTVSQSQTLGDTKIPRCPRADRWTQKLQLRWSGPLQQLCRKRPGWARSFASS